MKTLEEAKELIGREVEVKATNQVINSKIKDVRQLYPSMIIAELEDGTVINIDLLRIKNTLFKAWKNKD